MNMDKVRVIRELIKRKRDDFDSYFIGTPLADRAQMMTELAVSGDVSLRQHIEELNQMIPDTENDGSWKCSYALNTGVMIESLIAFKETGKDEYYDSAIISFFDSVDFKVQEELEKTGVAHATEDQIASHPIMLAERAWFDELTKLI